MTRGVAQALAAKGRNLNRQMSLFAMGGDLGRKVQVQTEFGTWVPMSQVRNVVQDDLEAGVRSP